jgi:hypothetical protein
MSLLFDNSLNANVSFTVKSIPEKCGIDTVLLGKDVWMSFAECGGDPRRVPLSIGSLHPRPNERGLKALTCWGVLDEEV